MADFALLEPRSGFGLATVMARKGVDASAIGASLGLEARDGPVWTGGGDLRLLGVGPGTWLAHAGQASGDWAEGLRGRLGALASVSDQSGGYAVFRLSGPGARTCLQRGASIDFRPPAFAPGSVATTVIAHIGVIVWQVDDAPVYEIALFRSFAASFLDWFEATSRAL